MLEEAENGAGAGGAPGELELTRFVTGRLSSMADPARAVEMAGYAKSSMPCFGVGAPERRSIEKDVRRLFPPSGAASYSGSVLALWNLPRREEKYIAIGYAGLFRDHITPAMLGLYARLIREGAWWDFVDAVISRCISPLVLSFRSEVAPAMREWIEDPSVWIARAAVLCQLKHRRATDAGMLFEFCLKRASDRDFFMRKAIGWALREYSYTDPGAVAAFLRENRDRLSGLSSREGSKALARRGIDPLRGYLVPPPEEPPPEEPPLEPLPGDEDAGAAEPGE